MTIQPARPEGHASCPLHAEKPGIQPIVGSTQGTHAEQVVSSYQKILRGSQLTWYVEIFKNGSTRAKLPTIATYFCTFQLN